MRGVSLRPSCMAQTTCSGVCLSDSWTPLATLLRCMQPRRKSWLNSEAKSFPQISARRVCIQQTEMLLMFIIWPDSLFAHSRWSHLPILCVCVCVCLCLCLCLCLGEWAVPSVLTAFFPKPKWNPKTPSLHCPWLFHQVAHASLHPENNQNSQELTRSWRKMMGSKKKKNYHRVTMPYFYHSTGGK